MLTVFTKVLFLYLSAAFPLCVYVFPLCVCVFPLCVLSVHNLTKL